MSSIHTPLPAFMRTMTPEKFKAMSKEDQRAYQEKAKAVLAERDARIDKANAENHKKLAFGMAELIADNPRIESEIVGTYLARTGQMVIPVDFYVKHPRFAQELADYEIVRLKASQARKRSERKAKAGKDG